MLYLIYIIYIIRYFMYKRNENIKLNETSAYYN